MTTTAADDPGGRATVAGVFRAVDDVRSLMEAHFDGVKQRLDKLDPLPERLATLEGRVKSLERAERDSFWRRHGVTVILVLVSSAPGWLAFFLHH